MAELEYSVLSQNCRADLGMFIGGFSAERPKPKSIKLSAEILCRCGIGVSKSESNTHIRHQRDQPVKAASGPRMSRNDSDFDEISLI
jgi:hypothetical protein